MYNVMSVSFGCLVFALLARAAQAATVEYFLTVTLDFQAPDCVTKLLYAVNGQYPGPALNATQGDTVVVHVTNNLYDQNTAIHFHGLHKKAAPFYDGAYGASDCGIRPGETFTYTFSTGNQVGTFWYHSHLGLQRSNGLYGLFIIYPKASVNEPAYLGYDAEMEPMLLNDWWHENIITQQLGLFRQLPKPFIFVGNPLSLLINGVGTFNCSDTAHLAGLACNATNPDCGIPVFDVVYGMTYRLRIVGVTSLSYMTLNIQAHNLTLVEADGFYTEPLEVENLDVNGAQSFSVLLKADQPVGNYWIQAYTRFRAPPNPPSVLALLRYSGASSDSSTFPAVPPQQLAWNATGYYAQQRAIVPRAGFEETVPAADRAILLVAGQGRVDGAIKWSMNNYSFVEPSTPYLLSKYYGLYTENDTGAYDEPAVTWNYTKFLPDAGIPVATGSKSLIYDLAVNETVQIVVQNSYALNNRSEQHPWHLHGHDFWVGRTAIGNDGKPFG
eukprot:TRINITY_DN2216_c0_g1_i3.p1 TRINITY_DN2216_c0_g1~~TRINITY_DN2216_c0_g1_i3.p1  ORF type:complete len:498 (-),score=91.59 TRINITY_DN2216_c0_g1_i3:165-1658(-)